MMRPGQLGNALSSLTSHAQHRSDHTGDKGLSDLLTRNEGCSSLKGHVHALRMQQAQVAVCKPMSSSR